MCSAFLLLYLATLKHLTLIYKIIIIALLVREEGLEVGKRVNRGGFLDCGA